MTTTRKPTPQDVLDATQQTIREITEDINDGTLPWDVNCFSVLHDYVDANMYGGICDEDSEIDWWYDPTEGDAGEDAGSLMQGAVHIWLVDRARRLGITEHTYDASFGSGTHPAGTTPTPSVEF
jgi:hypothetical protein